MPISARVVGAIDRERKLSVKLYSAIAKALVDNGITTMFGVVGDANVYMVDSFRREHGGAYVAAANEAGAAVMALGFATASGGVGVATVTHGPALTNTLTALVEGVKGQTPMLLLCGDTAAKDRDGLQTVAQRELIVATGAGFEQLRAPETVAEDIAMALRRAMLERRPVALNMPIDFQWLEVDYAPVKVYLPDNRGFVPESDDLDNAVGIIAAARRPIVLAGRGATDARSRDALLRLANRIDGLLATTLKAKDLFRGEVYNLGIFGTLSTPEAVEAIMESDCIIAFGASLNDFTLSDGVFLEGKRVIQCNAEPGETGKYIRPDAGLIGDAALVADKIIHWLDEAEIPPAGLREDRYKHLPGYEIPDNADGGGLDVRMVLSRLNDIIPPERILVTDAGRFIGPAWTILDVSEPRAFLYGVNFGCVGLGMSYAIGASFAAPERKILLVTGDGGFMLGGLQEFNTAARYNVDMVVVVCNDGAYGAEYIQLVNKNVDTEISLTDWPDFAPIAEALGGKGLTVASLDDLEQVGPALKHKGLLLLDVKLNAETMPNL